MNGVKRLWVSFEQSLNVRMQVLTVRIPMSVNPYEFLFFSLLFFFHASFQEAGETISDNIFDSLPVLSAPKKVTLADELTRYLATPTEVALDPLLWWIEKQAVYPHLSRMARDYLSIPGTTKSILIF